MRCGTLSPLLGRAGRSKGDAEREGRGHEPRISPRAREIESESPASCGISRNSFYTVMINIWGMFFFRVLTRLFIGCVVYRAREENLAIRYAVSSFEEDRIARASTWCIY